MVEGIPISGRLKSPCRFMILAISRPRKPSSDFKNTGSDLIV